MRYFALLFTFIGFAAFADDESIRSKVTTALDNENFAELEVLFSETDVKARASGDYKDLRAAQSRFSLAHRERFAKTKAWHAAYPQSLYAASALAEMHVRRAHLLRGELSARYTSQEAFASFREEIEAAERVIAQARALDPDYVPALEEAAYLAMAGASGDRLVLVNRLVDIAPDRRSMRVAIDALRTQWGGSLTANISLCTTMSHKVPDYDAELCMIEMAFANHADGLLKSAALAALAKRDEPFLDHLRLDAYIYDWHKRPEATEEVKRLQRASLGWDFDVKLFMNINHNLAKFYNMPFFAAEMDAAGFERIEERLRDEPQNHFLARDYVFFKLTQERNRQGSVSPALLAELMPMWPDIIDLGRYNAEAWTIGWKMMAYHAGFDRFDLLEPFIHNRIYFSNQSPNDIQSHMQDVYRLWEISNSRSSKALTSRQKREVRGPATCALTRASRVFEAVCQASPHLMGCNIGGMTGQIPEHARRISKKADQCWQAHADLDELWYRPVEVPKDVFELEASQ